MLGEPLLRRHDRIPADESLVALPRHRARSGPSSSATSWTARRCCGAALENGGFNIIKSNHLGRFLAAERPDLADLEPLLGLDPMIERRGDQMPLFGG